MNGVTVQAQGAELDTLAQLQLRLLGSRESHDTTVSYSGWCASSGCLPWCRPTPFHSSPLRSFAWKPHAPCHGDPQNHLAHHFWARLLFQMHANDSLTKPEVARCQGSRASASQLGGSASAPLLLASRRSRCTWNSPKLHNSYLLR